MFTLVVYHTWCVTFFAVKLWTRCAIIRFLHRCIPHLHRCEPFLRRCTPPLPGSNLVVLTLRVLHWLSWVLEVSGTVQAPLFCFLWVLAASDTIQTSVSIFLWVLAASGTIQTSVLIFSEFWQCQALYRHQYLSFMSSGSVRHWTNISCYCL